jgi:hypothetical protein
MIRFLKIIVPFIILMLFITEKIHGAEGRLLLVVGAYSLISGIWNFCPFTGNKKCN